MKWQVLTYTAKIRLLFTIGYDTAHWLVQSSEGSYVLTDRNRTRWRAYTRSLRFIPSEVKSWTFQASGNALPYRSVTYDW
jgi:hypothetical protein